MPEGLVRLVPRVPAGADLRRADEGRRAGVGEDVAGPVPLAWEKQVLSAREFKWVGRHSEYAI